MNPPLTGLRCIVVARSATAEQGDPIGAQLKQLRAFVDAQRMRCVRAVEAQTVDSAQRFVEAEGEIVQTLMDWQAARDAMERETSARRKAESVRKVLAKMVLKFTPTGRKRPTSVLTDWVFVPVGVNGELSPPRRSDSPQPDSRLENYYRQSGFPFP